MKTILASPTQLLTIDRLISDIRTREIHARCKDCDLLHRALAAFSSLGLTVNLQPATSTTTAESVAHRISPDPPVLAAIHQATDGLGPYFRLVAASKSIACPRCHSPADVRCIGERLCDERTWAYAAQRRRDKANLTPENAKVIRNGLATGIPEVVASAIRVGIVRLERTPDDAGVQWVDAV
jgi:hypothetical protein